MVMKHSFRNSKVSYSRSVIAYMTIGWLLFVVLWTLLLVKFISQLIQFPQQYYFYALLPFVLIGAALLSDLVSGLIHFAADTFFSIKTPIIGPTVIYWFREHHFDPLWMTRHSFILQTGDAGWLGVPILIIAFFCQPHYQTLTAQIMVGFTLSATFIMFLTNRIHSWAHVKNPPRIVVKLQKYRIILPPAMHAAHHAPPHKNNYCITLGILNPFLDYIGFFTRIEKWVRKMQRHSSQNS